MTFTRLDRKYLLTPAAVDQVLMSTRDLWSAEIVAGLETQRYETEYFDTADLALFHAARGQRPSRAKVRVRHYLDTGDSFVEVKRRDARGQTTKEREPWSGSMADARSFLQEALGSSVDPIDDLVDGLLPTARTSYERRAYVLIHGGRITVDRHLVVGPHEALTALLADQGSELTIMETKSPDQSPTKIDRHLWDQGVRPVSLSKYALAIASFRPDLPLNRWTSVANYLYPLAKS
jgi:VTC domain